MDEQKIKEQYLNNVKNKIKWEKARTVAVTEISDHIDDLYDGYIAAGESNDNAMDKAVKQLGNPEMIGSMLNKVYRPNVNFEIIIMLVAFAMIGCVAHGLYSGYSSIIGIMIGVAAAACLYWLDYEKFARKIPLLYSGFVILTAAVFVFDEFFAPIRMLGSSRWCYILMLSPFLHAGLIYYLKNKKIRFKIPVFWGAFIIPLMILAISGKASFVAVLLLMDMLEIVLLIKKDPSFLRKMCKNKAANIIAAIIMLAALILSVKCIVSNFTMDTDNQIFVANAWKSMQFTGENLSDGVMNNNKIAKTAFPLLYLSARYGLMSACVILFFYALLAAVLVRVIVKQKSGLGSMLSRMIFILYAVQLLVAILCNLGVAGQTLYISFPFFGGVVMTFIDYVLLGVLLSISRYQNIKFDEYRVCD